MSLLTRLFGTKNEQILKKKIFPLVDQISALEPEISKLSDTELQQKTPFFKNELSSGKSLDDILVPAFAVCRETAKRVLGQRHYDVQLAGGIVLHRGCIAEMKTGEGKTLTATLSCYLRALAGRGVHVVTVNEYLARRDAQWMGKIYQFLGLSVGVIDRSLDSTQRKEAYHCDITYGTNNEFGFDYLRDNMKTQYEDLVQRDFYFAIVDEVDSILIDEARTPLIISGQTNSQSESYKKANQVIFGLIRDIDYITNEKSRGVTLTDDGMTKIEKRLKINSLYDLDNINFLHHINQALKAHVLYKKDVDYVLKNSQVVLIDEHTGRLMPGRRFSDGLHSALEAKEGVEIQKDSQTLASITFQNLFRMYDTLSGMTGTADTEAVEFKKIYNLDVLVIPTNKPIIRKDNNDIVFRSSQEKFSAIASLIAQQQKKGQPILVGTTSVEKSELLSSLLKKLGIEHNILNAKNHLKEAEIIASAGHAGNVTIATNMAGRGTDIQLGPNTKELGGLLVIGTERHESRRIDNQLRGRSGRQGDPGSSYFFLSLEDDLMRIFASDRISSIMKNMGFAEGQSIESSMVSNAIEKAQKRVEEQNFSSRKHLLEYDDVINVQRTIIYKKRKEALEGKSDINEIVMDIVPEAIRKIYDESLALAENLSVKEDDNDGNDNDNDNEPLIKLPKQDHSKSIQPNQLQASQSDHDNNHNQTQLKISDDEQNVIDIFKNKLKSAYEHDAECFKMSDISDQDEESMLVQVIKEYCTTADFKLSLLDKVEELKTIAHQLYLHVIDIHWKNHLVDMDALKDSVRLRGYGQRDPLQEYKKEAYNLFASVVFNIDFKFSSFIFTVPDNIQKIKQKNMDKKLEGDSVGLSVTVNSKKYGDTSNEKILLADPATMQYLKKQSEINQSMDGKSDAVNDGNDNNKDNHQNDDKDLIQDNNIGENSSDEEYEKLKNSFLNKANLIKVDEKDMNISYSGSKNEDDKEGEKNQKTMAKTFVRTAKKVGRNDPCPCGSGKKYKKCCGKGL